MLPAMFTVPRFKPCYTAVTIDDRTIGILSESSLQLIEGELYVSLAKVVDGQTPSDNILRQLSDRFSEAQIYFAMLSLADLGVMEEANEMHPRAAAFWGLMPIETDGLGKRLSGVTIGLLGLGCDIPKALRPILLENGIGQVTDISQHKTPYPNVDLTIAVVDDYLEPGLAEFNRYCFTQAMPWLLFKPAGVQPWMGPLFIPSETGCWHCLASRLQVNRHDEAFVLEKSGLQGPLRLDQGAIQASVQAAINMLVLQITGAIADPKSSQLAGNILSVDYRDFQRRSHCLIRRPQCKVCGQKAYNTSGVDRSPKPLALKSRKKRYRTDGGHRTMRPDACYHQFRHHVSPITGVVHYVEPCQRPSEDGGSTAIPSAFLAAFSPPGVVPGVRPRKRPLIEFSAGKGATEAQAKTSALCEALERYSWSFQGYEPRRRASYHEVAHRAVHPRDLMLISDRQYQQRKRWQQSGARDFIPLPFDPAQPIDWSPVWSLTHEKYKLLPTAYLYSNYNIEPRKAFCRPDSNGNAAGSSLEDAILAGLMEVVERDAVTIWWYNRIQRPGVDLSTQMADPHVEQIVSSYGSIGRKVWVLDVTGDLGIPVFVAVSSRMNSQREEPILGMGAHLDPKIALLRALTEMNQLNQTLGSIERIQTFSNEEYPYDHENGRFQGQVIQFMTQTQMKDVPYLLPSENLPPVQLDDYPDQSSDDLLDDITHCTIRLHQKGMEVLVLDQTRPDVGIRVVKVIVPGMRMLWRRFAKGRLYDVPVAMKWLDHPTTEDELNPMRPPV